MDTITALLICGAFAAVFMSFVFLWAKRIKRYDIVDAAWGMTFIVIALVSFSMQHGSLIDFDLPLLTTVLVSCWGVRLALHILRRIRNSNEEDPRYTASRGSWKGSVHLNAYVRIFLLQALLALLISVPVIHINTNASGEITALAWAGVLIWVIGFWFEVVGDRQLRHFVSDPKNKGALMIKGLWRYSRHPNYFGELTQWWAIFLVCLSVPSGWLGVVGPVLITYLILFVSGVPLNERRFAGRPGWSDYHKRTSMIIPFPPR